MREVIITGASRGIGRALALALANEGEPTRLVLSARDRASLDGVQAEVQACSAHQVICVEGDLSSVAGARSLGERLASLARGQSILVHNAGLWPSSRELSPEGFERAFVVNHLGPMAMQAPLLAQGKLRRVLVVGAGLMIKGRFHAERTPYGADFSSWRTYCDTKLCFAVGMRAVAREHPELDVLVIHPGVVRTDLGARGSLLGFLLRFAKRSWEDPAITGQRLARVMARPRWGEPSQAQWMNQEQIEPWPQIAEDEGTRAAVEEATRQFLSPRIA